FPGLSRTEGRVPTCYSPVCRCRIATPARLACVKPAASVRSEPGSNSQVGLETLNRLITTFDEVPPFIETRFTSPLDHGVTLFKTCTAEVFRPVSNEESRSFLIFETRKDSAVHVSLSSSSPVKQPGTRRSPPSPKGKGISKDSFDGK